MGVMRLVFCRVNMFAALNRSSIIWFAMANAPGDIGASELPKDEIVRLSVRVGAGVGIDNRV